MLIFDFEIPRLNLMSQLQVQELVVLVLKRYIEPNTITEVSHWSWRSPFLQLDHQILLVYQGEASLNYQFYEFSLKLIFTHQFLE